MKPYAGQIKIWRQHWQIYGGTSAVFSSLYFIISIVVCLLNYGTWSRPNWWDVVIASVPTLLGFSLAGLAVFLSMDSGFTKFISGKRKDGGPSPFMVLMSSFVHFIVVQVLAFLYAITAKSLHFTSSFMPDIFYKALPVLNMIGGAFGFFLFLYAISLIVSTTFTIFRSSVWYEGYAEGMKKLEQNQDQQSTP